MAVEIRTVISSAVSLLVALSCLIVVLVVLLLLPAMRVLASVLQFAPFPIHLNFSASVPSFAANLTAVCKDMWFTAEVLPVVGVLASFTEVVLAVVIEWAPNCLEVEHVEVYVFLHQVEHVDAQFFISVGEGAEMTELAVYEEQNNLEFDREG